MQPQAFHLKLNYSYLILKSASTCNSSITIQPIAYTVKVDLELRFPSFATSFKNVR